MYGRTVVRPVILAKEDSRRPFIVALLVRSLYRGGSLLATFVAALFEMFCFRFAIFLLFLRRN